MKTAVKEPEVTTPSPKAAPKPQAYRAPGKTKLALLACALTSSLLLFLSFFPVNWGVLGWVALVPYLILVRAKLEPMYRVLFTYLCGVAFYLPVLAWTRVADPRMNVTWIGMTVYCAIYFPVGIGLIRWVDRRFRLPFVFTVPVVWIALEYVRGNYVLGGFGWYQMGYSQQGFSALIQIADLGGVLLVSFLVVAVNALVAEWVLRSTWLRERIGGRFRESPSSRSGLAFQSALVLMLFATSLGYGAFRLQEGDFKPGPRLVLVQGTVPQGVRNARYDATGEARARAVHDMAGHYFNLTALGGRQGADMIVWPETAWPDEWMVPPAHLILSEEEQKKQKPLRDAPGKAHIPMLVGVNLTEFQERDKYTRYNSAILLKPGGETQGRYDKIHRVPFGEYVPLREYLPIMDQFAPYDYDYSIASGKGWPRLPLGNYKFGVVICYEDTVEKVSRGYVLPGEEKVDFIVNISNDGWFDGSWELEQHLAICRFRAIETRRAVARSVNMGISALVNPNGEVLRPEVIKEKKIEGVGMAKLWKIPEDKPAEALPESEWYQFKSVPGVLIAQVPLDDRTSLYATWGDWLPLACWILLGGLILIRIGRRILEPKPVPVGN